MRPSTPILAALVLLGSSLAAKASDITYNVTGTLQNTYSFSGQYALNSTTNVIDSASFTVTGVGGPYSFTDTTPGGAGYIYDASFLFALHDPNAVNTLVTSPGGGYSYFDVNSVQDAVLTATVTAATPEPSSLILLGSGVLGLAGAIRRRLVA